MDNGLSYEEYEEIVRLAAIGYWLEEHQNAVIRALESSMQNSVETVVAKISPYEKALDSCPLKKK